MKYSFSGKITDNEMEMEKEDRCKQNKNLDAVLNAYVLHCYFPLVTYKT